MMNRVDREIIHILQGDLPLEPRPYAQMAQKLGIDEEEIIVRIRDLQKEGVIRRCCAVLRHQKAGYVANAMVAWKVDPDLIDDLGRFVAQHYFVSHCYHRAAAEDFGCNLFAMVHAVTDEDLQNKVEEISRQTGLDNYQIIRSVRELKKTSMRYID